MSYDKIRQFFGGFYVNDSMLRVTQQIGLRNLDPIKPGRFADMKIQALDDVRERTVVLAILNWEIFK